MEALLQVRGLTVELAGYRALTDVCLDVPEGACVGIVGETGSGKTLTCRFLTGLLGRIGGKPIAGTASFDGVDLVALPEKEWRAIRGRRIALVPQSSLAGLNPVIRVGRQLEETIKELDPGTDRRARALELLELVHMPTPTQVLRLYPHELSGGMRQRVMIALALAGRPELLVADEPTTALDVTVQRSILELLTEIRLETKMAVVLVTHDLALVQSIGDWVVVMYGGTVVEAGPADAVLACPAHPYSQALLGARPGAVRRGERLVAIPGGPPGLADRPTGCQFSTRCPHVIDRCREAAPALDEVAADHDASCWRAKELLNV